MSTTMSAAKDLHKLMRTIGALTDGQASMGEVDWDEGSVGSFTVVIQPTSGFYKGGKFDFLIHLGDTYPSTTPPIVRCKTDIHHPNIDMCDGFEANDLSSNICLNLFEEGTWNPSYGLESIVLGLLFLLNNPNFDSPLNEEFDEEEVQEDVGRYMRGEEVRRTYFDVQFLSNVDGKAEMSASGGASVVDSHECDVDLMNAMCPSEEKVDTDSVLTKQGSLKKRISVVSLSQTGETVVITEQLDARGMKLVTVDDETVLVNYFSCHGNEMLNTIPCCTGLLSESQSNVSL